MKYGFGFENYHNPKTRHSDTDRFSENLQFMTFWDFYKSPLPCNRYWECYIILPYFLETQRPNRNLKKFYEKRFDSFETNSIPSCLLM